MLPNLSDVTPKPAWPVDWCAINGESEEILYPPKYGDLIQRRKELNKLQAQRESYTTLLHAIATELVSQRELSVAVTEESIKDSEDRLTQELGDLKRHREEIS